MRDEARSIANPASAPFTKGVRRLRNDFEIVPLKSRRHSQWLGLGLHPLRRDTTLEGLSLRPGSIQGALP